jgi:hypothetical protein
MLMVEIPEDVKLFLSELEKRGKMPGKLAVERPTGTYDFWKFEEGEWKYEGEWLAEDVFREPDIVVCGKMTCSLFLKKVMDLVYDREERRVHEPEEAAP